MTLAAGAVSRSSGGLRGAWLREPETLITLAVCTALVLGIFVFRVPLSQIRILKGASTTDAFGAAVAGIFLLVGLAAVLRFLAIREAFYLVLGLAVISSGVLQVAHTIVMTPELQAAQGSGIDAVAIWLRDAVPLALALSALIPYQRISGPRSTAMAVIASMAMTIGLLGAVPLISGVSAPDLRRFLDPAVSVSLAAALAVQLVGRLWASKLLGSVLLAMLTGMLSGHLFLDGAAAADAGSYLGAADLVMLAAGTSLLVGGLLELFSDFSSLRIASARLEDRNRALEHALSVKSQFLSTVSHELMTPLNAILGFGQLLHADQTLTEMQRFQVTRVCAGGKRLQRTLSKAVIFAELSSGGGSPRPKARVRLRDAVLDAAAQDDPDTAARLVLDIPDDLVIQADGVALSTILANLLDNAARFSPAGSRITVTADTDEAATTICVADQGTGIRPADQERIFEPFIQLSSGMTRSHEGVGLGLPISKMLAESIGGSLEVASGQDKGCTFRVRLPSQAG